MKNLTKTQKQLIEAVNRAEDKFLYVEIGKKVKQNTIDSLISLNAIEIHDLELGGSWGDDTCHITLK